MERLDENFGKSEDLIAKNIEQLKQLFPGAFTEGKIDFDVLKQLLGEYIECNDEKYGLNWFGKKKARQFSLTPSLGTLRPRYEDSIDWNNTQNVIIEGDNLEVLKLLQKSMHGKIKLIYIDPPYNTGFDFVYTDNFKDNIKNYLEITSQSDGALKLSSNTENSGRFHTQWLNMMYPRLVLARNLLRNDGAILISIDENEIANLLAICNDIFGEENFVECLVYDKKAAPKGVPPVNMVVGVHEYILCYAKSSEFKFIGTLRSQNGFSNPDNDPRGPWRNTNLKSTVKDKSTAFTIKDPLTDYEYTDTWAFSKSEIERLIAENRLIFPKSVEGQVRMKEFFSEFDSPYIPIKSSLGLFDAQKNTEMLVRLMGEKVFLNPKSLDLMIKIISITTSTNDIVLDFFAGIGTTGHAVMEQNALDNGSRRYILVQLPELLDVNDKDQKTAAEYCARLNKPCKISELTKERIRRSSRLIKNENKEFTGDLGFRVFYLDSTNIKPWNPSELDLEETIDKYTTCVKQDRSEQDILFELLLKLGLDLSAQIDSKEICQKIVYNIGFGVLLVCLTTSISSDEVEPLAQGMIEWIKEQSPETESVIVFRDSAFENDVVKTNITAIFNQYGFSNIRSL